MSIHTVLIIGWVAALLVTFVLWCIPGRVRSDGRQYRKVPGGFVWFSLVGLIAAIFWPSITDGWAGLWGSVIALSAGALLIFVISKVRWLDIIATLAVAGLLLGPMVPTAWAATFAAPEPTASATPAASDDASSVDPEEQVTTDETDIPDTYPQRYLDVLRDNGYELEEVEGQTIPVFVAKSTMYEEKLWTDAVCLPVGSHDEVLAMVLGSPDCAAQVASGLYRLPVIGLDGTTTTLGTLSLWLDEFKDEATLNDWAQSAMDSEGADRIEYARKLVLIAVQLERFTHSEDVEKGRETSYNFHAVVDGTGGTLSVDESNPWDTIPEFELSPRQYKGDFITYRVTYKGYEGCWSEFGINIGDGRFAGFPCKTPTPEPEPEPEPTPTPTTPPPAGKFCTAPDGTKYPEGDERCNPVEEKFCTAPDGTKYPEGDERCNPVDKPDELNPDEPEGVDVQDQDDPIETEPTAPPSTPIDTEEEPGDSIPPGDDGEPVTPVDGDEGNEPPSDPPAEDTDNTGDEENPADGDIIDPDAAGLLPLGLIGLGLWRRRGGNLLVQ